MRIALTANVTQHRVKEASGMTVTARFYDDSADPWTLAAPTTARYRIDCGANSVLGWTSLTPATSIAIPVTATDNALQSQSNANEPRQITVQANAGLSTQYSETYEWSIVNVAGIS